jgi:hypothetical protein
VEPGDPLSQEATPADLADWRFEGDLNNQGTGGYGVRIEAVNNGAGGPVYAASPNQGPTCVAGRQQVLRAGHPAQLDGTASYSLGGDSGLTYMWQELSGPTGVLWTGQNTARPSVSRTTAGSYVFQLTAVDQEGRSGTCTVKHGFVGADKNDVVITGNAAVDALLGPMVRQGTNPWTWFDDRHKAGADLVASSLDSYYTAGWIANQGPGSITVTGNSTAVTGVGTDFTTRFCQGPGNPTVPKQASGSNSMIAVWFPDPASPTGRSIRTMSITSCQDDAHLTLYYAWPAAPAPSCGGGGCPYSYDHYDQSYGKWFYPSGEGSNYYDAVAGLYALYYRSGLEDYRTAARTLADRFWVYRLSGGWVCSFGGCGGSDQPRVKSLLGMVLRATDGRPDMWPGLRQLWADAEWRLGTFYKISYPAFLDIREGAYSQAALSYCAMFDPDATWRSNCRLWLVDALDSIWTPHLAPDGSFPALYAMDDRGGSWADGNSTVTLVNGSTAVVGNGTHWDAKWFHGGSSNQHIVFMPGTGAPLHITDHEQVYYTPTFIDGTHLTLDRPYEGTSGTKGWIRHYGNGDGEIGPTGYAAQPFMEGILGTAFEFTAAALADTNPAKATLAHQYNASIAAWMKTAAYRPTMGGMQYFAGSVDCLPPIPETSTWCTAGYNESQSRTLAAESLRSVVLAYAYTKDPVHKEFADLLYSNMWGKPGSCAAEPCATDGHYLDDFNSVTGWYMSGDPSRNKWHKYFGMAFGIGAGAGWPAQRIGGQQPRRTRSVYVGFNAERVAGTRQVVVTATAPDGSSTQTSCSASPCVVAIDDRQGDHIFQLEYRGDSGAVLAATEIPAIQGR